MEYQVIRTDKADELIHRIILYVAEQFGNEVALEKLDELETAILSLGENPYLGVKPRYAILRRQGYFVLITRKDLVLYKVNEKIGAAKAPAQSVEAIHRKVENIINNNSWAEV